MKDQADLPRLSFMLASKTNVYLSRTLGKCHSTRQGSSITFTHGPSQAAYFFLGDCLNTLGTFLFPP